MRAVLAAVVVAQVVALLGNIPSVLADTDGGCNPGVGEYFHCYSEASEGSDTDYTGLRELRVVQNLNLPAPEGYLFTTMWLQFLNVPNRWVELGTAYGNNGEWDFAYGCAAAGCDWIYWATTQQTAGEHSYKIDRQDADHYTYDLLVDGALLCSQCHFHTSYPHGIYVHTGLESYDRNMHMPTYASYGLRYATGDGSFRDWAGRDGHGPIYSPMCGQWHLDTSWWAGEHDSCV